MKTRIRISLIIVMFLAAAGLLYAANRMFFANESFPTGITVSPTQLLVSQYCRPQIDSISPLGVVTPFATVPGNIGECKERYMAISPGLGGWAPTDIYLTDGTLVYKIPNLGGAGTLFATVPDCGYDHSGITFDHVGTFGFDMIVTCDNGIVARINPAGVVNEFAFQPNTALEGPLVAPLSFGPFGGQVLAASDDAGKVWAIKNDGTFTLAFSWAGAESVHLIPDVPCPFSTSGKAFFSALQQQQQVVAFPATDFLGFGGDIIVPSEQGLGITKIHWNGSSYDQMTFDTAGGGYEGSAFVDCSIPSPTPTPTPTATFTPTPTPTATFTPTPTATFTPTPTATATFTPTPTATATFTPTPTATATATATSTPTPTPTPTPMGQLSKITPTGTTCNQFVNGTADTLAALNYSVSGGTIKNNVTPGVFFYWVAVTAPAGNNSFTITQTITTGNFNTFFNFTSGSNVFSSSCNSVSPTITQNPTTKAVTVMFNAPVAGTYIISIKYDSKSVAGATAPNPTTVHYDFATTGVPGSTSGLDLVKN